MLPNATKITLFPYHKCETTQHRKLRFPICLLQLRRTIAVQHLAVIKRLRPWPCSPSAVLLTFLRLLPQTRILHPLLIPPPPLYTIRRSLPPAFELTPSPDAPYFNRVLSTSDLQATNSTSLPQGSTDAAPPTAYISDPQQYPDRDNSTSDSHHMDDHHSTPYDDQTSSILILPLVASNDPIAFPSASYPYKIPSFNPATATDLQSS